MSNAQTFANAMMRAAVLKGISFDELVVATEIVRLQCIRPSGARKGREGNRASHGWLRYMPLEATEATAQVHGTNYDAMRQALIKLGHQGLISSQPVRRAGKGVGTFNRWQLTPEGERVLAKQREAEHPTSYIEHPTSND